MWKTLFLPAVIASSFAAGAVFYKLGSQLEWWPPPSPVQNSQALEALPLAAVEREPLQEQTEPEEIPPINVQHPQSVTALAAQGQTDSKGLGADTGSSRYPQQGKVEEEEDDDDTTDSQTERLIEDTVPGEGDELIEAEDTGEYGGRGKIEGYPEADDLAETESFETEVVVVSYPEYVETNTLVLIQPLHHLHRGFKHHHKFHEFTHDHSRRFLLNPNLHRFNRHQKRTGFNQRRKHQGVNLQRHHSDRKFHSNRSIHVPRKLLAPQFNHFPKTTHNQSSIRAKKRTQHHFRHDKAAPLNAAARKIRERAFTHSHGTFKNKSTFSTRKLHFDRKVKGIHFRGNSPRAKRKAVTTSPRKMRKMRKQKQFRSRARRGESRNQRRRR